MASFRLVLLALVLIILAAGFRSRFGAAFPARILHPKNPKIVIGSTSASDAPPLGSVLWSADMETADLSQWSTPDVPGGPNAGGGAFDSGTATAGVDAISLAHSGIHSAKLYINTSNSPGLSTSGARLFRWLEPEGHSELYYSVWYYFPQRYAPSGNPPLVERIPVEIEALER